MSDAPPDDDFGMAPLSDAEARRFAAGERKREADFRRGEVEQAVAERKRWRAALQEAKNTDAEASVIGGVLLRNDVLAVLDDLECDDFYDPRHRFVFEAVRELQAVSKPVDLVMLAERLAARERLEAVGGYAFLGELALRVPTPDNVEHYKDVVRQHAVTRKVLAVACEAPEFATDGLTGEDLLDRMLVRFGEIERPNVGAELLTIASVAGEEQEAIEKWVAEPESRSIPRLPWRIETLDKETGGVPIGLVTVLGARPGVGKTTLLLNFAMRRTPDEPGIVFTNEDDPREDLAVKFLAWEAQIDSRRIRERELSVYERELVARARASIEARLSNVRLVRAAGMTSKEMRRIVMADRRKRGTKWAAIDYLQNMPRDADTKITYAIRADMQRFQVTALEERIAWIVCSQISRESAKEKDGEGKGRRPALYDFRDSGSIEECGKLILAIHPNPEKPDDQVEIVNLKNVRAASRSWVDVQIDLTYSHVGDLPPGRAQVQAGRPAQRSLPPPPRDDVPHYADRGDR